MLFHLPDAIWPIVSDSRPKDPVEALNPRFVKTAGSGMVNTQVVDWFGRHLREEYNSGDDNSFQIKSAAFLQETVIGGEFTVSKPRNRLNPFVRKDKVIFLPMCIANHWRLLVVVNPCGIATNRDVKDCCILYLDSNPETTRNQAEEKARDVRIYLAAMWKSAYPDTSTQPSFDSESIPLCSPSVPKQKNGLDCGIYTMLSMLTLVVRRSELQVETFLEENRDRSPIFDYNAETARSFRTHLLENLQQCQDEPSSQASTKSAKRPKK